MYCKNFLDSLNALWAEECGFDKKTGQCRSETDGGLNDNPNDKGSITKFGISLRFYKGIYPKASKDSIRNLTKEESIQIYWDHFYSNLNYDKINNLELSRKLFLTAVNMGKNRPNKWIQQICNDLGSKLIVDGILGKISIEEINRWCDINLKQIKESFIKCQLDEYDRIIKNDPSQKIFKLGWKKRANKW